MENLFKKRQDRLHVFEKFRNPQSKPQEPKEIPGSRTVSAAERTSLIWNCRNRCMSARGAAVT